MEREVAPEHALLQIGLETDNRNQHFLLSASEAQALLKDFGLEGQSYTNIEGKKIIIENYDHPTERKYIVQ